MILIVVGTGYGVYYQIDNHNKKNQASLETTVQTDGVQEEVETLDINDQLVQTLYNRVGVLKMTLFIMKMLFIQLKKMRLYLQMI